jgi:hypothetical protein
MRASEEFEVLLDEISSYDCLSIWTTGTKPRSSDQWNNEDAIEQSQPYIRSDFRVKNVDSQTCIFQDAEPCCFCWKAQ